MSCIDCYKVTCDRQDFPYPEFCQTVRHETMVDEAVNLLKEEENNKLAVAAAEIEVRLDRFSCIVLRHDGVGINQRLAHVTFVPALHDIRPGRGHFLGMGCIIVRAGFIIDHPECLVAFRTVYIQPVNNTSHPYLSPSLY